MPEATEREFDDERWSGQSIRSARDAYAAARDVNIYHGPADSSRKPDGPGLFSVRPPFGRLPVEVRGRDEMMDLLCAELFAPQSRLSVLHGLGGCGKSTVALSVGRRAGGEGRQVWWVSAADPTTLHSGLRQLAIELGVEPALVQAAWEGELSAPDLLWRSLDAQDQPWLLVVDEADDPAPLAAPGGLPTDGNGWLRESATGAVLVTTRDGNPDVWRHANLHPLRELPVSHAAHILLDQLRTAGVDHAHGTHELVAVMKDDLTDTALRLAGTLGGLPLALHMAGSYLGAQCRRHFRRAGHADSVSFAASAVQEYDVQVRADVALLDKAVGRRSGGGPRDAESAGEVRVTATWERSLRLLEDRGLPEARSLLQILASYESTPVPLRTLDPAILARSPLFPTGMDPLRRDDALEALVDLALVEERLVPSGEGDIVCVKLHRLVAETVAAQTAAGESCREVWSLAALLLTEAALSASAHEGETGWWTLAAPHCLRLLARRPERAPSVHGLLAIARTATGILQEAGAFVSSAALATAAYELAVCTEGPEDRESLLCRFAYARTLGYDSQGPQATIEIRATWQAQVALLGPEHLETLDSRSYFGDRLCMEGHYTESERHLSDTAEVCARALGPDHATTLQTQNRYAITLRALGRCRESIALHRQVLAGRERTLGGDHREVTRSRNNLAFTLAYMGRYREGEAEHRINLEARHRLLGPDHPLTLVTKSNLALLLRDVGRLEEAEALCQQVLDARIETRGLDHTATLIARSSMLRLRLQQGRAAEVLGEAREVLDVRHRKLGPAHPSTLLSVGTLGSALLALGQLREAEALFTDLHSRRLAKLGAEHELTLTSTLNLSRLREAQGRYAEALALARPASEIWSLSERTQHFTAFELRFQMTVLEHTTGELDPPAYASTLRALLDEIMDAGLAEAQVARSTRRELTRPGSRHAP
ncbi:tetratricopeptide repeat protein [Streptomyces sp. H27-S2]|uniref:tetratricopeptide repeat protein n=1 Tax=Streptomyces antarcticus TaxID=2996458 RepID=UPI00226EAE13|nr:tetratricopeptide repeat protein [Streptomyces sp. H27-S2]MCY0955246.1 tetratricopeptide repeat protein [Streptomyces sp. H27-S2]